MILLATASTDWSVAAVMITVAVVAGVVAVVALLCGWKPWK